MSPKKWLKVPDGTKNAAIYVYEDGKMAFVADGIVIASDGETRDAAKAAHNRN